MQNQIKEIFETFLSHQDAILIPALRVLVIIITGLIAWWIFNFVIRRFEKKVEGYPLFQKNKQFFSLIKKAGHYIILILVGIGLVNLTNVPMIERIFSAFMIMLLASIASSISHNLLPFLEDKVVAKTTSGIDNVILDLLKKFASVIIYATGVILALDILGVNIMPFIAGAGVAGIAIGFAAKDTLSNVIAGILLIIDRPFEIGDRIEVWSAPENSATWGDVLEIGLRATKIRTTDNIVIIIPNNEIMTRDIINYTTITKEIRVRVPIGIAYDADIKKAKEAIERISYELDWVMREKPTKVVVKGFGDSAVNLEARVWIRDPKRRIDTVSHISDRVKEVFDEEGIEIPFPKRDVYIKKSE